MILVMNTHSYELYHHGVKGMKWGVRRFQKKDGSLTPVGKKRYSDSPKKSKHRLKLEAKYRSQGMSQQEAEIQAKKRIQTERILVAAGATTIAAAAAYAVHKNLKVKGDGMIKAGGTLRRVEVKGDGVLHDTFYAVDKKSDGTKYVGKLGVQRKVEQGKAYLMKIDVDKDIKVAGRDKAIDVYTKLFNNDKEFRESAILLSTKNVHGGNPINVDGNDKKRIRAMYENFNTHFTRHGNPAVKKFYAALKEEGYGAVRDVNDMKFSGYNAKNPLIIFDHKNKLSVTSVRELHGREVLKKYVQDGAKEAAVSMGKVGTATVAAGTLYTAGEMYVEDRREPTKK